MIVRAKYKPAKNGAGEKGQSLKTHAFAVALVFGALLRTRAIRNRFEMLLNRNLTEADEARLSLFAYLHDFGKTNAGFQAKLAGTEGPLASSTVRAGHIRETRALFGDPFWKTYSRAIRLEEMAAWMGCEAALSGILIAMLSHHGRPVAHELAGEGSHALWKESLGYDPMKALAEHIAEGQALFRAAYDAHAAPLKVQPQFVHFFAGILQLADWIGSDETYFPFTNCEQPDYDTLRANAQRAVQEIGLDVSALTGSSLARTFGDLFQDVHGKAFSPSPIQACADDDLDAPIFLIESETGSGKTEAALWRFAKLFARGDVDSLYFALPTRVAATQIFNRTKETAKRLFGTASPGVLLAVPGQARVDDKTIRLLPDPEEQETDEADCPKQDLKWAAERPKRFLAARIAIGTIDQALLSTLKVKHAHLRHVCLARSLLVIDEVHASDVYQTALMEALLGNHTRVGGKALLMSATLGSAARNKLLRKGSSPGNLEEERQQPYPAISTAKGLLRCDSINDTERRREKRVLLQMSAGMGAASEVALIAALAVGQGATVLVIRNTVGAAQSTQKELETLIGAEHPALFRCKGVTTLHHGRFAKDDRAVLDATVEEAIGKKPRTSSRIVIGTQTLEQSLDIDADYLITDLCPVDILLQRIGRLHRHKRRRPEGFEKARCAVLTPADRDLLKSRGLHGLGGKRGSEFPGVYSNLPAIEATWRLIEGKPEWIIPDMNRQLVEDATHPEVLESLLDELAATNHEWNKVGTTLFGRNLSHRKTANLHSFSTDNDRFDDERFAFPDAEQKILTRLGADNRTMLFPTMPAGPFGIPITEMSLPGYWRGACAALRDDGKVESITQGDGGFQIALGAQTLVYDRWGLRLQ